MSEIETKIPEINLSVVSPELVMILFGILIMLSFLLNMRWKKNLPWALAIFGCIIGMFFCFGREASSFNDMVRTDALSNFFRFLFCFISILIVLVSKEYLRREGLEGEEYYALILFATSGMMFLASGEDLLIIFLGLEILSIASIILTGFHRGNLRSEESALKYFILGAFSSGFLLYGMALIYGMTGNTNMRKIAEVILYNRWENLTVLLMGIGLLLVGFGFKIALVPFHMWTPDVYEGAPTSVTAFLSAGVKAGGFAAVLRTMSIAFPELQSEWTSFLIVLSLLTMVLGSVMAIVQSNIKRMLAYSSIAHAGYISIGVLAVSDLGSSGLLFYIFTYAITIIGAFCIVIILGDRGERKLDIVEYAGLGKRHPVLAACMAGFMFSLAGIPPTGGFTAKIAVFGAAINVNLVYLVIIGVLTSVIGVFYYLRVVVVMYMSGRDYVEKEGFNRISFSQAIVLLITTGGVILLGIFPSFFIQLSTQGIVGK